MEFGILEISLLILAALIILFMVLWAREALKRWWAVREQKNAAKRGTTPSFYRRD